MKWQLYVLDFTQQCCLVIVCFDAALLLRVIEERITIPLWISFLSTPLTLPFIALDDLVNNFVQD